jgi:hypothetical protein
MCPVGGSPARRLRGATGMNTYEVQCVCGTQYRIPATALKVARCPKRKCKTPTRKIPEAP